MLTLKKIKVARSLSEETTAYTCDVYWNGKCIAHAKNNGCGGMTFLDLAGSPVDYRAALIFAETQVDVFGGETSKHTLDSLVDHMVEEQDQKKGLRASLKRQLARTTRVLEGTQIIVYSRPYAPLHLPVLQAKHPKGLVLNACSFDEAFEAMWAASAPVANGGDQ